MVSLSTLSGTFGYVSIGCWLGAQLPQVVKNYHLKSCEGLSLPFLVTWLLGDLGNLIGCILTDQLPFQTYLAGYFCLVDLSLLYQFFYYRAKFAVFHPASRDTPRLSQSLILPPAPPSSPRLRTAISERPRHARGYTEPGYARDEHAAVYAAVLDVARAAERATRTRSRSRPSRTHMVESFHSDLSRHSTSTVESPQDMRASSASLLDRGRNMSRGGLSEPETREVRDLSRSVSVRGSEDRNRGRRKAGVAFMALALLATGGLQRSTGDVLPPDHLPPPSFQRIFGRISAWACTTLYLSSRLPQIWKNFTRRSVEGLSMYLFLFAFLGNTFYVISIMLNPARSTEDSHYLLEALPYLLGSGGTLVFDITILSQSLVYGSAPPSDDTPYQRSKRLRYRRAHTEDGIEGQPLMGEEARERSLSPDLALRTHPHKAKTQP